jgi:chemotaxis protein histidine kinase CheA
LGGVSRRNNKSHDSSSSKGEGRKRRRASRRDAEEEASRTTTTTATMHPNTHRRRNVAMMMRGETTTRLGEEEGVGWCLAAQQQKPRLLQQQRRRTKATTRVAARRRFEDDHHHHHSESSPERRKKENAAKKKKNEMSSPIADADADPRLDHPEMDAPRRESGASSSSSSSFARDQSKAPNDNQQHSKKKKKKKTPTTKKKNPNATATRTATTKENVKISNASATKNGKKTTTAATNANANVTTKEEEEALPKKEEEEVEDEDQAPKHETTVLSKEQFQMQKKRLELLIEEKEWAVEEARDTSARSSVKLQRVLDYVNAVEAYKELCSSRVPDTVSDFLGNYVNVLCLPKHAKGYDEALSFLGIDFEDLDEDDLEITHEDFMRETEHYMRIEQRYDSERKSAKGSIEDQDEYYDDDDDDEYYDDDDELLDALLGGDANYIAEMKLPLELHLAQDIDGNWRWLEDDLGRVLRRKPEGDFIFRLMSFEDLMNEGLNVNCLREEVDPNELIDFSKCRSFEDARRAMKEATDALRNMEADGWVVEKSFSATATSWGASSSGDSTDSVFDIKEEGSGRHLCMTKELRPLRTMSHVDGLHPEEDEKSKREVIRREEAAGAMAKDAFDSFDDNE